MKKKTATAIRVPREHIRPGSDRAPTEAATSSPPLTGAGPQHDAPTAPPCATEPPPRAQREWSPLPTPVSLPGLIPVSGRSDGRGTPSPSRPRPRGAPCTRNCGGRAYARQKMARRWSRLVPPPHATASGPSHKATALCRSVAFPLSCGASSQLPPGPPCPPGGSPPRQASSRPPEALPPWPNPPTPQVSSPPACRPFGQGGQSRMASEPSRDPKLLTTPNLRDTLSR